jgi:hypothetical protein
MSNTNAIPTQTRTFTYEETEVLVRVLLACRTAVTDEDRKVIDGIIRDGWSS